MFFILRAGAARRDMHEKYGPWMTVYDCFREWRDAQVFERLWTKYLRYYEQKHGLIWEWKNGDGACVRSPLVEKETGSNPTDRANSGMKDHVLVDGRGVTLSVVVTAANVNDHTALPELLNNHAVVHPRTIYAEAQHICLGARLIMSRRDRL